MTHLLEFHHRGWMGLDRPAFFWRETDITNAEWKWISTVGCMCATLRWYIMALRWHKRRETATLKVPNCCRAEASVSGREEGWKEKEWEESRGSDECDECHKIAYKVNVKTRSNVSFQAMRISWYTWCKSHNEAFIASIAFIVSLLKVENIELFRWHRMMLHCDGQSFLRFSWCQRYEHCRYYQMDLESNIAVNTTVDVCEYRGAPTTRLYTLRD